MFDMILAGFSAAVLASTAAFATSRILWSKPCSAVGPEARTAVAVEAVAVSASGILLGMLVYGTIFSDYISTAAVDAGLIVSIITSPLVGLVRFCRWAKGAPNVADKK